MLEYLLLVFMGPLIMGRIFLFIALFLPCAWSSAQEPKLYVFLPSPIRPHAMQTRLTQAFPEWDILVFGRFREFELQIETVPPAGILTLPVVAENFPDFKQPIKGMRGQNSSEGYVLLSVNQPIQAFALPDQTIGAVDLLGRRKMELLLAKMLGQEKIRVRTVTKYEDLLSLLQFQDVDAILVPKEVIGFYTERSRLNLVVNHLPGLNLELPMIALRKDESQLAKERLTSLLTLNADLKKLLGVDLWQRP